MTRIRKTTTFLCAILLGATALHAAEVTIEQADDKSVTVKAETYTAHIDPAGNLDKVLVDGMESFGFVFKPAGGAPSINVINDMVAVRSGKARTEYTFEPRAIAVETEGFVLEGTLAGENIVSGFMPNGQVYPYRPKGHEKGPRQVGKSAGMVLKNGLTVKWDKQFHMRASGKMEYWPYRWRKKGSLQRIEFTVGEPATAALYLATPVLRTAGPAQDYSTLDEKNPAVYGLPHYADPSKIALQTEQKNLGEKPIAVTQELVIENHYVFGDIVHRESRELTLAPGEKATAIDWDIPTLEPGFYYPKVIVKLDGDEVMRNDTFFTVNLAEYNRPLTRPDDFEAFWRKKLAAMRAVPFDAKLTRNEALSSDTVDHYDLELTLAGGKGLVDRARRLNARAKKKDKELCNGVPLDKTAPGDDTLHLYRFASALRVPKGGGPFVARNYGRAKPKDLNPAMVYIQASARDPLYDEYRYRRWASRDDNDLLDAVLQWVRLCDFLAARDDVKGIYLWGASRTGPLVVITGALAPEKMAGVASMVATDAGIGYEKRPYRGWGMPRIDWGDEAKARRQIAEFVTMARYFDPINHAPDLKAPAIFSWGIKDNLARGDAIDVMYKHTASQWKRISRHGGGHQAKRNGWFKLEAELEALIGVPKQAKDDSILKEH